MNEQNADTQEQGLLKLQNLANDDNNEVTIAEEEAITTFLSAMKFHFSNAKVQEYGCGAHQLRYKNMVVEHTTSEVRLQKKDIVLIRSGVSYDNWHRIFLCMIHISLYISF